MKKIYLAGPDVFREDANEWFDVMKEMCIEYGFIGLSPFDSEAGNNANSSVIFTANVKLIDECDIVVANLDPFRGPNIDDGTAFEIGYAYAKGKEIWGYTMVSCLELKEITEIWNVESDDFPHVENFGLCRNLMIVRSIQASGGSIKECFGDVLKKLKRNDYEIRNRIS
jgi:nucleoside 2-deoxyribosyltransferase